MAVTPSTPRAAPTGAGSSAGFVAVALCAVVAALGVMRLEVEGAPWPVAPQAQLTGQGRVVGPGRASALRRDASSEAQARDVRSGLQRVGNVSGN